MFNSETAGLAAERGQFEQLQAFINLILDAKACGRRCEELVGLTTAAIEAKTAAEAAQSALAQSTADQHAALAKRKDDLDAYYDQALARDNEAKRKLERVDAIFAEWRRLEQNMTTALLNYSGWLVGFDSRLQQLPTLAEAMALAAPPRDVHREETKPDADPSDRVTEPSPDRVGGSTLTREREATLSERRAMRRGSDYRPQTQ